MNLEQWAQQAKGSKIGEIYGTQSPAVCNDYAARVHGSKGFMGDSHQLRPKEQGDWKMILGSQVRPGDIAIIDRSGIMPYGDSIVVTEVKENVVYGLGAKTNGDRVGVTRYTLNTLSFAWRKV